MKRHLLFLLAFGLSAVVAACDARDSADTEDAGQTVSEADDAAGASVPEYDAETFFQTTSFGMASSAGFAFSPDNEDLLVTSDESGVFNAYAMSATTGERRALTTSDTNATSGVTWFPDDRRILYTFDAGGNELNHIWVREENGETRDLTPGENLKAAFLGWDADGSGFYLTTTERDQKNFDVYRYDVQTYERELRFENDGFAISAISPDGRWLALTKNVSNADSDIYLYDFADDEGGPRLITEHEGNIAHGAMTFSADSAALVYSTNEHGEFSQAWTYDLESGEKTELIAADWDVMYVIFSPSGRFRVSAVNADASTRVSITDTEIGEQVRLPKLPDGDISSVRFSRDESEIAFRLASDTSPANIYVVDVQQTKAERLTSSLNPAIKESHLVDGQVVRYPSFDGLAIPGVLYRPHGSSADSPAPAMVWVHGGPGGQSRKGYRATIQHLVNHGYAIFAVNNRGSSGYGKTFFHMDDQRHGEVDLEDVVYARRYLEGLDWVDGQRIGVIGGSYGGYMVAAALAFRPDVFDVGIDIFGVTNWVRTLKSIPPWWASFRDALYDEMGDPAEDEERLRRISPLFHADNIVRPLLVVQGANDPRVLQQESDEIVEAVRANGVPVEYIVFDDEGHGFRKRENRIRASKAYVGFLDRYLTGAETAAGAESAAAQ